jgi:hypothetical protein
MPKPMIDQPFDVVDAAFEDWLATLSPKEIEDLNALIDGVDEMGVKIVEDDSTDVAPKEQKEVVMDKPKAEKVKCRCCGFAKKARRVNAEGICKVCYAALATSSPDEAVVVVGRQGKRGRNTVSVMIGGERVKVQRKVRLEA